MITDAEDRAMKGLSAREKDILRLAADGLLDKEIAAALSIRLTSIRTYWDRVRIKLDAKNRTHAVVLAMKSGDL